MMNDDIKTGFEPFFDSESKVLILGSFPSVKSRETGFYYGNKSNRFWKTLSDFFGDEKPQTVEEKKAFLTKHCIALWDITLKCRISCSKDETISDYTVAPISRILENADIRLIILNGRRAAKIFADNYKNVGVPVAELTSTSMRNIYFDCGEWYDALSGVFKRT